ncbi:unnamed protein product [Heterobilharzia americana]|nr:unnamed protein product [Heterobilharzia americana]
MKMIWINKLLLIITLILLYSMNMIIGCMKSSMFYRTPTRTRSHVFTPGEYQPKQIESNLEASGPLDTRDFHYQLPTKRLVRVDSPHILFDSEEARWMTKGCRDRLIKLSTQIQNTWAKQEVVLRVIRSWVKPPPNYKPLPTEDINKEDTDDGDSLLLYEKNLKPEKNSHNHEPVFVEQPSTVFSGQRSLPFGSIKSKPYLDAPIIDMTPEMIEDQFPQSNSDSMKKMRSQSNGLKFLHYIPSSTQKNRWYSTKNHLNYLPSYSSSTKQSLSVYPIHSQRVYQSPPPSSSAASVNVYNSYKVSSSLPDTSYNTMIRLPRNVISRLSNKTGNNTLLINNISSSNSLKRYTLHKIVERSVNTMYAPNIDRKNYNYNPNNKQKYLQNTIIMNELRMEEFHYAGRAVDIELTTRQYNRPHNVNLHLGVLAQIAYYVAHFDWCFFNRAGHVHCSVKPVQWEENTLRVYTYNPFDNRA